MKLIWHMIGKDVRRLRWRLVFWVMVLAAKTAFGFALLTDGGARFFGLRAFGETANAVPRTFYWEAGLIGLDVGLCYLLTVALVQEDLRVGTRAFLMTRPVSGGRLLAAKLLGAFLIFGVIPVLMWLPWWLHCGYGWQELSWAIAETCFWQLVVVMPAMMLAVLTDSLGRVLLWSFVGLVGVPVLLLTMGTGIETNWPQGALLVTAILAGIVLPGALVTVMRQYLLRQSVWSLAAFPVGCALAYVVIGLVWNHGFQRTDRGEFREENAELAQGVTLECGRAQAVFTGTSEMAQGRQQVDTALRLQGLPDDLILGGGALRQTLRWPGGPELTINGRTSNRFHYSSRIFQLAKREPDAETQRYNQEWELRRKEKKVAVPAIWIESLIARSMVARLGREPATYVAEVQLILLKPEIWDEVPFKAGPWRARAGRGRRIMAASVNRERSHAYLAEVRTDAALASDLFDKTAADDWLKKRMEKPMETVINRQAGGRSVELYEVYGGDPIRVGTVMISRMRAGVDAPEVRRGDKWVPRDPDWFADASLVEVTAHKVGQFTREVRTDNYTVSPEGGGK